MFKPSHDQNAIAEWFANFASRHHLIVRARAGTGKTTTILWAVKQVPRWAQVILCAFNAVIADELKKRLAEDPEGHPNAEAATLHAIGYRALRRFWEGVRVEKDDERGQRVQMLAEIGAGEQAPDPILRLVAKLCTLGRENAPLAQSWEDLVDLAWDHECVPEKEWEEHGWGVAEVCKATYAAMQAATKKTRLIDFADMIYLPLRLDMFRPIYDLVVVDEAQDMSAAQLLIAQRIHNKPAGRICVVGDDRQAIYAFRGADSGALDRLKKELDAEELGLKTTYRCGRSIAALAAAIVPDFACGPMNPAGSVTVADELQMLERVKPGDFILSRINAPLAAHCLSLLRKGVPAVVRGRDIAKSLTTIVRNLAKGKASKSIPFFLERLAADKEKQAKRLEKSGVKNLEIRLEQLSDKYDTLAEIAAVCVSVDTLCKQIDSLFEDSKSGRVVMLSSIHKAKGLEAEQVWVLRDTLRHRGARSSIEEQNLAYVAYTRAKNSLVIVCADGKVEADE